MTTFVFIDTNIYVRFISQGKPGCEPEHWDELVERVKSGSIKLLLPEIVTLEVEKQERATSEDVETNLLKARNHLKQALENQIKSTDLEEFPEVVLKSYDDLRSRKVIEMKERHERLLHLFSLPEVEFLEFNPAIWFRAKKRQIAGRLGRVEGQQEKDCCIVESLIELFGKTSIEDADLLFCSENHKEFGLNLTLEELKSRDESQKLKDDKRKLKADEWTLHPMVAHGLPTTRYFLDLEMLMAFVKEDKRIVPPEPEVVKKAVEREVEEVIQQRAGTPRAMPVDNLFSPIIGLRSLIQSHQGRMSTGKHVVHKIEQLAIEFEQARLVCPDAKTPFVDRMWKSILEIRDAVRMLATSSRDLEALPVFVEQQEYLKQACCRFMQMSAEWIDYYRESR